jgi:uncharacterized protein (DUF1697 family)
MIRYIALLRGVNVGGKNIIKMADLKTAFEERGFEDVATYINSGNVVFSSGLDEAAAKEACEKLIAEEFGLDVPVFAMTSEELADALAHAPEWWNNLPDARHDAFFVIPPMTVDEVRARIGAAKEEYEKVAWHGRVIFWSALRATFSRTSWSKLPGYKEMYNAITIRNANTTLKLAEITRESINTTFH